MGPKTVENDPRRPREGARGESVRDQVPFEALLRPEAQRLLTLQRLAGNRAVSALVQTTLQRVAWHQKDQGKDALTSAVQAPAGLVTGPLTPFSVGGYTFEGYQYDLPAVDRTTKTEVLTGIAAAIGATAFPRSSKFLTKKHLQKNLKLEASVDPGDGKVADATKKNLYLSLIDPFLVGASGKFGGSTITLSYQFGVDSYGYVVKIKQEGQTYSMHAGRGQTELADAQLAALTAAVQAGKGPDPSLSMFGSAHDTHAPDEVIAGPASLSTTEPLPARPGAGGLAANDPYVTGSIAVLGGRNKRLDAMTKLAGEGARWQCVRLHAEHLRNSSRFYTGHPTLPAQKAYITLSSLWGTWGTKFGYAFNVPNRKVADVILANINDTALIGTMTDQDAASDAHFDLDTPP